MHKAIGILALALASITSTAAAGPLYGTTVSFFESAFCKKYGCVLVTSGPLDPQRYPGVVNYTYRLTGGATVQIGRDSKKVIGSASLNFEGAAFATAALGKGGEVVAAFAKAVTGQTFANSYATTCIQQVRAEGFTICRPLDAGAYRLIGQGALAGQGMNGKPYQDTLTLVILKPN